MATKVRQVFRRPSIRGWAEELGVDRSFLSGVLAGLGADREPLTDELKRKVRAVIRRTRRGASGRE